MTKPQRTREEINRAYGEQCAHYGSKLVTIEYLKSQIKTLEYEAEDHKKHCIALNLESAQLTRQPVPTPVEQPKPATSDPIEFVPEETKIAASAT